MLEETELKKKLKEFSEKHQSEHSANVSDFKISKNISSGNGFSAWAGRTVRSKDRAQVCASGAIMEPIVNSVIFKFTESPFDFVPQAPKESLPLEMDFAELKFQLSSCLRDAVTDGLSYLLVYKKENRLKFSRLSNFNVIFGDCDYADGEDVQEAVYVDKRDTGRKQKTRDRLITFDTVLNLNQNEISVVTYYYKHDGKVCIAKLEGEDVAEHKEYELAHIPISRIYGKEVPGQNFKRNWRGIYHLVRDTLQTMDYEQSRIQELIACAPTFRFWIAEEALSNPEQYSRLNDFPTAYKTFKATNPLNPQANLPAPANVDQSLYISELMQSFAAHKDMVYETLGSVAGAAPGNETAEAVLLRRENKDTAANEMIKNLLDSSRHVAEIIKDFTGIETKVVSDIFEKAKQNEELQKIIAMAQFLGGNPHAYAITPVLVSKLDIDDKSKQMIVQLLGQEKEGGEQSGAEMEMLKLENQQLRASQEAQLATARINAQASMAKANIDAQIKHEELKFKYAELQQKGEAEGVKLAQNAQKIADEYEREAAKISLEGIKNSIADTIHSVV